MADRKKDNHESQKKEKLSPGIIEAGRWLLENPQEASLLLPSGVKKYLKTMGVVAFLLVMPALLITAMFTAPAGFLFLSAKPEVYHQEQSFKDLKEEEEFVFEIKFSGVVGLNLAPQKITLAFKDLTANNFYSFENILAEQKTDSPQIFRGKISLPKDMFGKNYDIWVKGPVHLQRKFSSITLNSDRLLDLSEKPLLPGDLDLPESGQDNKIDELDRDYLWSLIQAAASRHLNPEEIQRADLDLDGKISGRDMSLLINSGVGTQGEE